MINKIIINVNNYNYNSEKDLVLIDALARNNIEVPRFCFNENLSIAGNCRMCLVEIKNTLKPVVSCAINVVDTMIIYTNTKLVKRGRENVLEFLLINHPLDCPICDQGGECDLQDQSYIFGSDKGRFYEFKRAVVNHFAGPIIKTILTRCIHCTRCIRFFEEVGGLPFFGMIKRGASMQISIFKNTNIDFELSGNVIDLCPVGALTLKPNAFIGRAWEYDYSYSIDCFDTFCAPLRIDYKNNQEVIRIVPRISTNNNWITDKTRLIYDVLNYKNRYNIPYILYKNIYIKINWKKAIKYFVNSILNFEDKYKLLVLGDYIDLVSLTRLKFFSYMSFLKTVSFYCKYFKQDNFFYINHLSKDQTLFFSKINFFLMKKKLKNLLLLNCNLRYELPILNFLIRKYIIVTTNCFVFIFGNIKNCFNNFKYFHSGITNYDFFNYISGKKWICNFFIDSYKNLYVIKKTVNILLIGFSTIFQPFLKKISLIYIYINKLNKINYYNFNIVTFLQSNITLINLFFLNLLFSMTTINNNKYLFYYCLNDDVFDFDKNKIIYKYKTKVNFLFNKKNLNWINDKFEFFSKNLTDKFYFFISKNDNTQSSKFLYLYKNLINTKTFNFNQGIKIYQGFNIELLTNMLYKERFNLLLPSTNWFEFDSKTYKFDGYIENFFKIFNKKEFNSNIKIIEKIIDYYQIAKMKLRDLPYRSRYFDFLENQKGWFIRLNKYDGKFFYFLNKILISYKNFYFYMYKLKNLNIKLMNVNIFLLINFFNKYYNNDIFSKMSNLLNVCSNFFKKTKNV